MIPLHSFLLAASLKSLKLTYLSALAVFSWRIQCAVRVGRLASRLQTEPEIAVAVLLEPNLLFIVKFVHSFLSVVKNQI